MTVIEKKIQINIAADGNNSKYHYVPMSKEYSNYTRQKSKDYDPLEGLVTGMTNSISNALGVLLCEKEMRKMLDDVLTDIARNTDGMSFKP